MRVRSSVLIGLLGASSILSATLWWQLRAERKQAAAVQSDDSFDPAAHSGIQLKSGGDDGSANADGSSRISNDANSQPTRNLQVYSPNPRLAGAARVESLKDPEYRAARVAQVRANQVRRFPGLAEALGISADASDDVFDLLAEHQLNLNANLNALDAKGIGGDAARVERNAIVEASQQQRDAALRNLLGSSGYDRWEEYQENLPYHREAANMLKSMLGSEVHTVSETQLQVLASAAAAEERSYQKQAQKALRSIPKNDPKEFIQVRSDLLNARIKSNQRILDAAAGALGPTAYAALRDNLARDVEAQRASLRSYQQHTAAL